MSPAGKPRELVALERTEAALGDAVALIGVQLGGDDAAAHVEALRIMRPRPGESGDERVTRITRTLDVLSLLASAGFDIAGDLITDEAIPDGRALLSRYAVRLVGQEERRRAIMCRVYDRSHRPPLGSNQYCPLCSCGKSGRFDEPNPVDESCDDVDCVCHSYEEPTS